MNVFVLDMDPKQCAMEHNDSHVVKMCTEYAQMLSTCHRVLDGKLWWGHSQTGRKIQRWFMDDGQLNHILYKATHVNHPSNVWLRSSESHYRWLYSLWTSLCDEYTYRYGKIHLAQEKLENILLFAPTNIPYDVDWKDPPPAMKQYPYCIVHNNIVSSYRNYYWEAKREFSKWTKRPKPGWWCLFEQREISGTLGVIGENGMILE